MTGPIPTPADAPQQGPTKADVLKAVEALAGQVLALTERVSALEKRCEILKVADQLLQNPAIKSKLDKLSDGKKGWSLW